MKQREELAGKRFGRLLVASYVGRGMWLCVCECGIRKECYAGNLRSGDIKSCGCLKRERDKTFALKHGMRHTKTYEIWKSMRARCNNSNNKDFAHYGGRGISVCKRWHSFSNFHIDMGECPLGYSIERKNVNGNYEPGNCCWIPMREQAKNRRDTVETIRKRPDVIRLRALGLSQQRIADELGMHQTTVSRVIRASRAIS